MKAVKLSLIFSILVAFCSLSFADMKFMLYGYKIGQKIGLITNDLGKPDQVMEFEDGFKLFVYKFNGYNVYFETATDIPDLVWSIQLQGYTNANFYSLDSINLADDTEKMIQVFGKPDFAQTAVDQISHQKIPDTMYYDYTNNANFSLEATSNKITSIKIAYSGDDRSKPELNTAIKNFLSALKNKDYYKIASFISPDSYINWNNKEHKLETSVLKQLITDKELNDMLFNKKDGLATLTEDDFSDMHGHFQVNEDGSSFMVPEVSIKGNKGFEIQFSSVMGQWVISSIRKNN